MLKKMFTWILVFIAILSPAARAEKAEIRKQETGLYKDVFEQNLHAEVLHQLDLSRLGRRLSGRPLRSRDINVFDEVPDNPFFTNRHAKERLSAQALAEGYKENDGPDVSGDLTVTKGKSEGLHPGFFIRDSRGDAYLFKFDDAGAFEMATAAEVIASRFYYAIGYSVPQNTLAVFSPEKLKIGAKARFREKSGFLKLLTPEKLEEILRPLPKTPEGNYRVLASKILKGENKGHFSFSGRRAGDPEDIVNHRDRREIRALNVFGAWINNNDTRESNTLDMLVTENGRPTLKHYLIDFNSTLGSAAGGAKDPTFGHEYMMDFGEAMKSFATLGFREKPWQRRWRKAGEKPHALDAVGYFDNGEFDPGRYKTQLPYETFKRVTRADGFWAAKIVMSFTDEDIRAIVSAGGITSPEAAGYLSDTLIARRDLVGKFWFSQSAPLDDFQVRDGQLVFKDLAVQYGFEKAEGRTYRMVRLDQKNRPVQAISLTEPRAVLEEALLSGAESVTLEMRVSASAPFVRVKVNRERVLGVFHQD